MMTIGIPVEREKELAEVFIDTYSVSYRNVMGEDLAWKWCHATPRARDVFRDSIRAVLDEAFRRLETNLDSIEIPIATGMYRFDLLRACKNFLLRENQ